MILAKLKNRYCWGARYVSLDTLVHWLSKKIRENGKRVQKVVKQLFSEGYLILHKGGETVSLNPARNREIIEFIDRAGN
jgi:hypothetical protein